MIVDYFGEYDIDTDNFNQKMEAIQQIDTEHSRYLQVVFPKMIEYLFEKQELSTDALYESFPKTLEENSAIVWFSNQKPTDEVIQAITEKNHLMVLGTFQKAYTENNVEYYPLKNYLRLPQKLAKFQKIYIGFHADDINYLKYYYTKMRIFFLHLVDQIQKTEAAAFKNKPQETCDTIVLNKDNFKLPLANDKRQITLRDMIKAYRLLLKTNKVEKIEGKNVFYTGNNTSHFDIAKLNELSVVFQVYSLKEEKEVIKTAYDIMCERMLQEAITIGYCDFIDNKCAGMRNGFKYGISYPDSIENGCCGNTYLDKEKNCRYLKEDHSCSICSISCRLFTCGYLQQKGIEHSLKNYPLLDIGFGKLKKIKMIHSFFISEEETLKKLRLRRSYR